MTNHISPFCASWRIVLVLLFLLGANRFTASAQSTSQFIINEVMVSNVDRVYDANWNFGSWIEIYNQSATKRNLKRYYFLLDDDTKHRIHINYDLIIPAHGYAVVWMGKPYWRAPNMLDIELNADGGKITFVAPGAVVLDEVYYPASTPRCSWARCSDGAADWTFTNQPTPEATNGQLPVITERLQKPQVSVDSKFFNSYLSTTVAIPQGATLLYTTDGTVPTRETALTSATGSFRITATTVFRFMLVQDGYLDSPVVTRSYIRKEHNISIPSLSIVTDPAHLYSDQTGFFVQGTNGRAGKGTSELCNWNMDWKRPVNVEYFTPNNYCRINQEVWMSRCGGHSKGFRPMSFKIRASKDFDGPSNLQYAFFADKPYTMHKALQFRNGCNDIHCRIFDAALQSVVRTSGIDIDQQDYQPVVHYINGKFMGTINLRETNNKHNVLANHGLDDDEIDMFEIECDSGYVQLCGTTTAWKDLLTLSASAADDEVYQQLLDKVDVDELCYYLSVQFYVGNTDWPQNNCKGWRPIEQNGRFRFVLYDTDLSFGTNSPFSWFRDRQWHTFCQLFNVPGVSNYTREVELVRLFNNLCTNSQFVQHFINTYCLVGGSIFESTRTQQIIRQLAAVVEPAQIIPSGYANRSDSPNATAESLIAQLTGRHYTSYTALQAFQPSLLQNRSMQKVSFSANISQARLLLNGQQVPLNKYSNYLFLPSTVEAQAPAGYQFIGWKDMTDGTIISTQPTVTLTASQAGKDIVATYDKQYDASFKPLYINEVSAANSIHVNEYFKRKDWVEIFNPTQQAIDLQGMYLSDDLKQPQKYQIQGPNTVVAAGGYKIIWCDDQPSEQYLHANFKLQNSDGSLVLLTAADQSWQDTLVYCAHGGRESVGRFPDGGSQLYHFTRPTIERGNLLNSYSQPWQPGDVNPDGLFAATQGSLGLTCQGRVAYLRGEGAGTFSVYSLTGQMVMHTDVQLHEASQPISLQLLRSGTYVITLTDAEGNVCRQKINF